MLVSSRSDRHIEHHRPHAHTVSGATLPHSASLNSVNAYQKQLREKEQEKKELADVKAQEDKENDPLNNNNNDKNNDNNDNDNNSNSNNNNDDNSNDTIELVDLRTSKDASLSDSKNSSESKDAWAFPTKEHNSNNSNSNNNNSNNTNSTTTKEKEGVFNFLAFRKVFTARELTSTPKKPAPRPLMRQKSYFLEEHMSFKESSLKAVDLSSLPKILEDRVGVVTFRNFLKSVFAEENLQFWSDVVAFKKEVQPDQKMYEARKIYVLYIHEKATYPLNCAATTKHSIQNKIENPDYVIEDTIFDEAQYEAYDMLDRDLFPRFRKSPYYHRLQEGLDENLINQMVKKKTGFLSIFHT